MADKIRSRSGEPSSILRDPEIVIGLIGPVGTDLGRTCNLLEEELFRFGYNQVVIRLSGLLSQIDDNRRKLSSDGSGSEFERIKRHMDAGTSLRRKTERGDILALMAVAAIRDYRITTNRKRSRKDTNRTEEELGAIRIPRTAYVLSSLKHPDEVKTLRNIYGKGFLIVSVYSPKETRAEALAELIAAKGKKGTSRNYKDRAYELIQRDEDEEEKDHLGQNVGSAFPLADLFVDGCDLEKQRSEIRRFLEKFYGHHYHSPTKDEFGMFQAKAASIRSADMSRQVGAVITSEDGEVLSVGCNEIPKFYGGLYWEGDDPDKRDFRLGYDSSAKYKNRMISEVVDVFYRKGFLKGGHGPAAKKLAKEITEGDSKDLFDDALISSVIEYGRSVHAEMAALMSAARNGISVKGGVMYSTTFPCHLCARHIIAAGISRVVYIEPYPKSMAPTLYEDSIVVDSPDRVAGKVTFQSFVGVSPSIYMNLFSCSEKRKTKQGDTVPWNPANAQPQISRFENSYILTETKALVESLRPILREKKIKLSHH